MQATRTLQQRAFSQLAKNAASKNGLALRGAAAAASSSSSSAVVQSRPLSTQRLTENEAMQLLNEQRMKRPSSPHFTIYEPQLSWLSSIANRVTGTGLSVGIYALAISYVAAPLAGLHFDSSSIISLISSLPLWAKLSAKTIVGAPFWFHTWNGMRHLSWDMGWLLDLKTSWKAGYIVLGLTGVSTIATTFLI